jgi:predicted amidophosphoribosyltransferase
VLPVECAGCRAAHVPLRRGACARCAAELEALHPRAVRPDPAPPGLPGCVALGSYEGTLRNAVLAYKERGRSGLAAPLGALLAETVAAAVTTTAGGTATAGAGTGPPRPVLLVPVPSTAAASRARHGDHVRRLTSAAAGSLRRAGWSVAVAHPLEALPKPDAATLDAAGRARAAAQGFRVRRMGVRSARKAAEGRVVVLVDDIVTTGSTLAAITAALAGEGVTAHRAAVLAATRRRHPR